MPTPGPGQSTVAPFITPKPISGSFTGTSGGNPVVVPFQPGTGNTGSTRRLFVLKIHNLHTVNNY